eukprot:2272585-Rhodomonas_salina.1
MNSIQIPQLFRWARRYEEGKREAGKVEGLGGEFVETDLGEAVTNRNRFLTSLTIVVDRGAEGSRDEQNGRSPFPEGASERVAVGKRRTGCWIMER